MTYPLALNTDLAGDETSRPLAFDAEGTLYESIDLCGESCLWCDDNPFEAHPVPRSLHRDLAVLDQLEALGITFGAR